MKAQYQISDQLSTLRDYIRWGVSEFTRAGLYYGHGTDNALDESLRLVLHVVNIPLNCHDTLLDAVLTQQEREDVLCIIQKRITTRKPLPYLTGEAWFVGLRFIVNKQVLIPRSPIAQLIETGFSPWLANDQSVGRILDLCTGSGCIGIACAYSFQNAIVDLSDYSEEALIVAKQNIEQHELQHRVQAIHSDLFQALNSQKYQLIVSNPPYVDNEDLTSMPEEYHHEPAMALASGQDGLDITRQILRSASEHLEPNGLLVVEVGNSCIALEKAYPKVAFTWVDFERGGHGVFVFTKEELDYYADYFR